MSKAKDSNLNIYQQNFPLKNEVEATVLQFILENEKTDKVVRIFEKSKKMRSLKDPLIAHNLKEISAVLGVSLDAFLNRYLQHLIEVALNKSNNSESILTEIAHNGWLKPSDIFVFERKYQIYKFRKMKFAKTEAGNQLVFKSDKFLELTITLPQFLMGEMLNFFKKPQQISMQKFFEKIFNDFVRSNHLEFNQKSSQGDFDISDLEKLIHKIGAIRKWQPLGLISPPIFHSQKELDNEFLCFSHLSKNSTPSSQVGPVSKITKRITLKEMEFTFDPFRELIYYVSNRLWRTPGDLISILIMYRYREWDRESFIFGRKIDRSEFLPYLKNEHDNNDLSVKSFILNIMGSP
ncbi:hypothetical protein [Acinetobacter sp.]|uniref:hypothetical protein n=1 Tax=Acinetobacter sp. TaxID=472 RepID=UPI0037526CF8